MSEALQATEIEITAEMIEAGVIAFLDYDCRFEGEEKANVTTNIEVRS